MSYDVSDDRSFEYGGRSRDRGLPRHQTAPPLPPDRDSGRRAPPPRRPLPPRPDLHPGMDTRHFHGNSYRGDHHERPDLMSAHRKKRPGPIARCSNAIVGALETFFYWLGYGLAKYPYVAFICTVILTASCGSNARNLDPEEDGEKLWVPSGSDAALDSTRAKSWFRTLNRFNTLILVSDDDILAPTAIQAMFDLHLNILDINTGDSEGNSKPNTWENVCARRGSECWRTSLLELWAFDNDTIRGVQTREEILFRVNNVTTSPVFLTPFNVSKVLGGIVRDENGLITGARAARMDYVLKFNRTVVNGTEVNEYYNDWEQGFLDVGEAGHQDLNVYRYAFRSRIDEGGGAIFGDIILLSSGYGLIIIFVILVLGRFNRVQHKVYISLLGVWCVVMALGISIGIGTYAGVLYSPLNSILPFLLIGLGVDDMFVIVQALENLGPEAENDEIPVRMGKALRSAGVSITVTSVTDMLAFAVGISTNLPALRSFCIYCFMGILFTFLLQSTFFVAWLSLDQRRVAATRDACCCCCIKYDDWSPNPCSQRLFVRGFFKRYFSRLFNYWYFIVAVILVTLGLLAFGIYGTIELKQESDWTLFIPGDSYASAYLGVASDYFPSVREGVPTSVYVGDIDYYKDFDLLEKLHVDLERDDYTESGTVVSWWYSYRSWLNTTGHGQVTDRTDGNRYPKTEEDFYDLLQLYMTPPNPGAIFTREILFTDTDGELRILASRNSLRHAQLTGTIAQVAAMDSIRAVTKETGLSREKLFPFARDYLIFEGNKTIQDELYRNLGLAFLCVAVMTFVLIANVITSFLISLCVIMSIVDVGGLIYFWGLTIDTVTSIILIVAMGLSIDYAAHIGHTFMTVNGNRKQRVRQTLILIGPAVSFGGFSTFLAFILLAFSKSYVFKTFFKVFLGVVTFGVFHGLVFLPAVLSLVGPAPYLSAEHQPDSLPEDSQPDDVHYPDRRRLVSTEAGQSSKRFQTWRKPTEYVKSEPVYIPRARAYSSHVFDSSNPRGYMTSPSPRRSAWDHPPSRAGGPDRPVQPPGRRLEQERPPSYGDGRPYHSNPITQDTYHHTWGDSRQQRRY